MIESDIYNALTVRRVSTHQYKPLLMLTIWNQWNRIVEWNSGMEYWNDL
jgi:hypothetical protein